MSKKNKFAPKRAEGSTSATLSATHLDVMGANLLKATVRTDLKSFFTLCRKDYLEIIDFTHPIEYLDDELPFYLPKFPQKPNAFTLFIKVMLQTGNVSYLLVNIVFHHPAKIAVGIADVPEHVVLGFRAFYGNSN